MLLGLSVSLAIEFETADGLKLLPLKWVFVRLDFDLGALYGLILLLEELLLLYFLEPLEVA